MTAGTFTVSHTAEFFLLWRRDGASYRWPWNHLQISRHDRGQTHCRQLWVLFSRVQFGKAIAVLTYQLYAKTTLLDMKYNCVEIYQQEDDEWHVIHSTWSFIRPMEMDFEAVKEIVWDDLKKLFRCFYAESWYNLWTGASNMKKKFLKPRRTNRPWWGMIRNIWS